VDAGLLYQVMVGKKNWNNISQTGQDGGCKMNVSDMVWIEVQTVRSRMLLWTAWVPCSAAGVAFLIFVT
jgi:hypothetical protein